MNPNPETPTSNKRILSETSPEYDQSQISSKKNKTNMGSLANLSLDDFNRILDDRFKNLATKQDIEPVVSELKHLRASNANLQAQVKTLEMRCDQLERQFEVSVSRCETGTLYSIFQPRVMIILRSCKQMARIQ